MRNDDHEELLKKLAATMAPVFDAQRQLLGLMMELRVAQNDMDTTKARVDKLETMMDNFITERAEAKEVIHERLRQIEAALTRKADKDDLRDVAKDAKAHEISTAKLLGGFSVIMALITYLMRKL